LAGIVHFYNTRDILDRCPGDFTEKEALATNCWPEEEEPANVNTNELGDLGLSRAEENAIVYFLKTLSDGYKVKRHRNSSN
jgi:cytochrome c peroxidase